MNGAKVIFNAEFIDEITRHRDFSKHKYDLENLPEMKSKLLKEYEAWNKKLEWAMNFQDTIAYVRNMDIPKLTVCKMVSGLELPAKNLQAID
jgi:hypothetical protein